MNTTEQLKLAREALEKIAKPEHWHQSAHIIAITTLAAIDAVPPAPQAAQPVESIDTPEFLELATLFCEQSASEDFDEPAYKATRANLTNYINERMHQHGYAQFNAGKVVARADNDALLRQNMELGKRAKVAEAQLAARPAVDPVIVDAVESAFEDRPGWRTKMAAAVRRLAQNKPAAPELPVVLELPAGDTRIARLVWQEVIDGKRHLCITVDKPAAPAVTASDDVPLPAPDTHCMDEDTGKDIWSHSTEQAIAYGDARAQAARAKALEEAEQAVDQFADQYLTGDDLKTALVCIEAIRALNKKG